MSVLQPQPEGTPLPRPGPMTAPFWAGCTRGELLFQRCGRCGSAVFDPAIRCRRCGGADLIWERSAGHGAVYSWSTVWRPQVPAFRTPYAVAIVDLDEGYQMVSCLVGCEPDDIGVGMRVAVEFHPAGGDIVLPYFRPMRADS